VAEEKRKLELTKSHTTEIEELHQKLKDSKVAEEKRKLELTKSHTTGIEELQQKLKNSQTVAEERMSQLTVLNTKCQSYESELKTQKDQYCHQEEKIKLIQQECNMKINNKKREYTYKLSEAERSMMELKTQLSEKQRLETDNLKLKARVDQYERDWIKLKQQLLTHKGQIFFGELEFEKNMLGKKNQAA